MLCTSRAHCYLTRSTAIAGCKAEQGERERGCFKELVLCLLLPGQSSGGGDGLMGKPTSPVISQYFSCPFCETKVERPVAFVNVLGLQQQYV